MKSFEGVAFLENTGSKSNVEISDETISAIIREAVTGTEGVAAVAGGQSVIKGFIGKKNKGISFTREEDKIDVNISIIVYYGHKITETAEMVQKKAAEAIETMTGLVCGSVNVDVTDVAVKEKNESSEGEK